MRPTLQVQRGKNLAAHYVLKKKNMRQEVTPVPESWLNDILDSYEGDEAFCHVGLSSVSSAFEGNPYEFLRESLHDHFETIMTPGHTDYFSHSEIYHKQYSKPKRNIGMFSRLLHEDAEYRTDDAMKSIIVDGPYRFEDCDHSISYGENSCFAQLSRDNVLIVNIGTPWLKGTQFHHLEYKYNAPYMMEQQFEGVLLRDGCDEPEQVTQTCGVYDSLWAFNRWKLRRVLEKEGVLDSYSQNGFRVMVMRAGEIEEVLAPKLKKDPYYIAT